MLTTELHSSLVYLDRDFISGKYELVSGQSPSSQITKSQAKKAGASIPVFSAEVSAIETRTFPISSLEMLATVMPVLDREEALAPKNFRKGMSSKTGWVNAELATLIVSKSNGTPGTDNHEKGEEQGYFTLDCDQMKLALITTPDYFVSGLDALTKMQHVLVRDLAIPVRAFVRVIAAQSYMDQWIAIPYVIYEHIDG